MSINNVIKLNEIYPTSIMSLKLIMNFWLRIEIHIMPFKVGRLREMFFPLATIKYLVLTKISCISLDPLDNYQPSQSYYLIKFLRNNWFLFKRNKIFATIRANWLLGESGAFEALMIFKQKKQSGFWDRRQFVLWKKLTDRGSLIFVRRKLNKHWDWGQIVVLRE